MATPVQQYIRLSVVSHQIWPEVVRGTPFAPRYYSHFRHHTKSLSFSMWRQARSGARQLVVGVREFRRASSTSKQKVVFSGIQPTGTPHLGNYAGAIRQWVHLQSEPADQCKLIYSVVDLHAITGTQQAKQLRQWKRETLAALIAAGIDPERSTLFYQSSVLKTALSLR